MTAQNTIGRANVVPLTNQTGGSVAAGDLVYLDTGHDESFTTGTTVAYTGMVGVVQDTSIANGAVGLVRISGYASLVNVNASVTRGHYAKSHSVVKQATDAGASRVVGAFGQFLTGGTTPSIELFGFPDAAASSAAQGTPALTLSTSNSAGSSGSYVGTDATIAAFDATSPADVGAAASAVGSAGTAARRDHKHAIAHGTSFPGSPATSDRYFRTDLFGGGIECVYDGTRWLGPLEAVGIGGMDALSGAITGVSTPNRWPIMSDYDLWVDSIYVVTFVNGGTSNSSNKWTLEADKINSANTGTSIGSFDTGSDTVSTWTRHKISVAAAVVASSFPGGFQVQVLSKTGAPGNLYFASTMFYRLIVT